jgi:uncharacterized cupredoxin-like copper-binding protein
MKMQSPRRLLLMMAALVLVVAACSSGNGGSSAAPSAPAAGPSATASASTVSTEHASTVSVHMEEFSLKPQPSSTPAGKVTFKATNDGKVAHELVVLQTDKAPGALPVAKAKADEAGDLGEAEDIAAGTSKSVTLALKPGHYVLICNLAGHYQAGMRTAFTVS